MQLPQAQTSRSHDPVLRLFPTVPITLREAVRETTLANVRIPAGTAVIVPSWCINRCTKLWGSDAASFRPERWLGSEQANGEGQSSEEAARLGGAKSVYSQITFLHGPRSCIGQGFARAELKCLVAAMVRRFSWVMENPDEEVIPGGVITIKPQNGLRIVLTEL